MEIEVKKPTKEELDKLGVSSWPIWQKEESVFDWHYDDKETCFFLEGQVEVETASGKVSMGAGDLVVFPKGLSCKWQVKQKVKKHYKFG